MNGALKNPGYLMVFGNDLEQRLEEDSEDLGFELLEIDEAFSPFVAHSVALLFDLGRDPGYCINGRIIRMDEVDEDYVRKKLTDREYVSKIEQMFMTRYFFNE